MKCCVHWDPRVRAILEVSLSEKCYLCVHWPNSLYTHTHLSEMSHGYESHRYVEWNKFMIKLVAHCGSCKIKKKKKHFQVLQGDREFIAAVCATVIYPGNASLGRTTNPQQFTNCKSLRFGSVCDVNHTRHNWQPRPRASSSHKGEPCERIYDIIYWSLSTTFLFCCFFTPTGPLPSVHLLMASAECKTENKP